jgi:two-component system chemotaxis sensor kinase CheA
MQDEEFLRTLRATFQVEASEHLQSIAGGLRNLAAGDAPGSQQPLVESVFRAAHSLKGAARAVNLPEIEALCQSLESLFAAWKRHESQPTGQSLATARRALEQMSLALEIPPAPVDASPALIAPQPASGAARHETVRIQVSALDERLLEAEEMLSAKLAADQRAVELGALTPGFDQWRKQWARLEARTGVLRGAALAPQGGHEFDEVADFLDWNQDYVKALEAKLMSLRRAAEQDRLLVGRLIDDLLENSKKLLMLPLATLAGLLNKVVRDLARDQGKEVELVLRGEDIAIDKRILEELKDPLIHLLRNSIDHGIEPPDVRRRVGKSPRARIVVAALPVNGNQIELSVSDDGGGIAVDKVRAAARSQGLATPEVADDGDEAAALALTLETGISTSPVVTDLSGRGLGLAIVRENTEKLGGRVQVESQRQVGTTIRMTLPMTLATARGVLVRCAQRQFVIPTAQVERVMRFKPDEVRTVESRRTLTLGDGRTLALTELADVMELPATAHEPGTDAALTEAVVLNAGEQRIAFAVDSVIDEREVLAKTLPQPLSRVRNISGATVLGTGEVVPILNVWDLMKSARHLGAAPSIPQPTEIIRPAARRVLVVEDSITSRMLLKGILESAGYSVRTAVDGIDGFTAARSERFDLIVSDVEMPRMNGFDLTARIRADRSLANVPVVLVTALESRADRERGIDVGANAYLVKSSLDQGNLLETLRRLA